MGDHQAHVRRRIGGQPGQLLGGVFAGVVRVPDHHHAAAAEQGGRGERGQVAGAERTTADLVGAAARQERALPRARLAVLAGGGGRRRDQPGDGPLDQQFLLAHHHSDRRAPGGGSARGGLGSHA